MIRSYEIFSLDVFKFKLKDSLRNPIEIKASFCVNSKNKQIKKNKINKGGMYNSVKDFVFAKEVSGGVPAAEAVA